MYLYNCQQKMHEYIVSSSRLCPAPLRSSCMGMLISGKWWVPIDPVGAVSVKNLRVVAPADAAPAERKRYVLAQPVSLSMSAVRTQNNSFFAHTQIKYSEWACIHIVLPIRGTNLGGRWDPSHSCITCSLNHHVAMRVRSQASCQSRSARPAQLPWRKTRQ